MLRIDTLHPTLAGVLWPAGRGAAALRTLALLLIGSALLTVSAKIQVPFWPVPMTMQTFVVLVLGAVYGWRLGAATVLAYLAEGAAGLPVFAGTPEKGIGIAYMMGPTGGYLIGFVAAAAVVGVVMQVAFSLIVILVGGLLVRSFVKLSSVNPGFAMSDVLLVSWEAVQRMEPNQQRAAQLQVLDRLRDIPGVAAVSAAEDNVLNRFRYNVSVPGTARDPAADYAISVASAFQAHLAGVAFVYEPVIPATAMGGGILESVQDVRARSEDELLALTRARLDVLLAHGSTTIEVKSGYGLELAAERKQLRTVHRVSAEHPATVVPTFLGAHAVPAEYRDGRSGYVRVLRDEMIPAIAREGLAGACDAFCEPVAGAFTVAETRVGQRTDYDRLTLTVETNGAITPEDAVAYAAALLQEHLRYFVDFGRVPMVMAQGNGAATQDTARLRDLLAKPIDECGLSVRSINSLKNSSINTLGDLVRYSEEDMLKVKNVGEKALGEIAELLRREGLNFGMEFEESDGNLVVTNPGAAPTAHAGAVEEA